MIVLIVVPNSHQSVGWVFSKTVNNAGFGHAPFFFIFLLGFLQAQYTYTGYDASAHMSEETRSASMTAAKGVVNSIIVSAVAGYALIMALTFAIKNLTAVSAAGGFAVITLLEQALGKGGAEVLLFIAVMGQLFCGMSAVTAASRMLYAFSRDRATPGWRLWSKLNASHVPYLGVILIAFLAFLLALPAWSSQTAFVYVAITSVATIGLYIAYILPVYLRLRAGDAFDPGPWSLGRWYKVLDVIAILWVVFICVLFILPTTEAAVPWSSQFSLKTFNYAPAAVGTVIVLVGSWWFLSARHWFKGPLRTVEDEDTPPPLEALPLGERSARSASVGRRRARLAGAPVAAQHRGDVVEHERAGLDGERPGAHPRVLQRQPGREQRQRDLHRRQVGEQPSHRAVDLRVGPVVAQAVAEAVDPGEPAGRLVTPVVAGPNCRGGASIRSSSTARRRERSPHTPGTARTRSPPGPGNSASRSAKVSPGPTLRIAQWSRTSAASRSGVW